MGLELARFEGCLMGLTCGDAVGTAVEFMPRGRFDPVTGMSGGEKALAERNLYPSVYPLKIIAMDICLTSITYRSNSNDPGSKHKAPYFGALCCLSTTNRGPLTAKSGEGHLTC